MSEVHQAANAPALPSSNPPYDYDGTRLARRLAELLTDDGLLVWESSSRSPAPEVPGLQERTSRKYGSARLTLFDKCSPPSTPAPTTP